MSDTPEVDAEDLYARLESLSKSLEACDRIDGMEDRDAYPTILDAMNFVRGAGRRVLHETDAYCPKCGHNRDKSSVSTIDMQGGAQQCQMCGAVWWEIAATATPTPPPLSPATPATVPAEPGSTPPADR